MRYEIKEAEHGLWTVAGMTFRTRSLALLVAEAL